jgi:hypothetical protein
LWCDLVTVWKSTIHQDDIAGTGQWKLEDASEYSSYSSSQKILLKHTQALLTQVDEAAYHVNIGGDSTTH